MNKRQKKKLYKQTYIRIKKLHPKEGDIICLIPDLDRIGFDIACQFLNYYERSKIFNKASVAIVPLDVKQIDKESAQLFVNELQHVINDEENIQEKKFLFQTGDNSNEYRI